MKSCNVPFFIVILVACVSSAVSSLVFPFYNQPFPSILECVSKSGNQDICDQFLFCAQIKAAPYLEAYYKCVNEFLPRGIGKCSAKEELYYNREMRTKLLNCVKYSHDFEELSDFEKQIMYDYQDCVEQLGQFCFNYKTV
ncbi:hypothetical protein CDAR_467911 [Caerostris darwini]|uniref:Uncharacterized protein n=1 Tax=Caerostris darwini TaxID=1538125 RepID=A0AAV4MQ01_9ARAC|nr:hypothetical protein CDAR_467911 [Caerostris darwini]